MGFKAFEASSYNSMLFEPYRMSKQEFKGSTGWQINLSRGGKDIVQLSEEQLNYAFTLIKKAKAGVLRVIREG